MVRQVKDVTSQGSVSEVRARMSDTYNRPLIGPETRLERIAESLIAINPQINRYLSKKQEDKDAEDMAVGAELYRKLSAEYGQDLSASEIGQLVKEGKVEGFTRLKQMQEQGIIQARYEVLAPAIEEHMDAWSATASVTDADGNEISLSDLPNSSEKMRYFNAEAERYVQEKTGGKFDALLYEKLIKPNINKAVTSFIRRSADNLINKMKRENMQITEDALNMGLASILKGEEFIKNPEATKQLLLNTLTGQLSRLASISGGFTKAESLQTIATWFDAKFKDHELSVEAKEMLKDIAEQVPDLMYGQLGASLNNAAERGIYESYSMGKMYKSMEEDRLDTAINMSMHQLYEEGYSFDKAQTIMADLQRQFPEHTSYIYKVFADFQDARSKAMNSLYGMSDEDFREYQVMFMSGQGSVGLLTQLAKQGLLNTDQFNELNRIEGITYNHATRDLRLHGHTSIAGVKKQMQAAYKNAFRTAKDYAPPDINIKNSKDAMIANKVAYEIYVGMEEFKSKNPNASFFEEENYKISLSNNVWNKYAPAIGAIRNDIKLLNASPEQIQAEGRKNKKAEIRASFKKGETEAQDKALGQLALLAQKGDVKGIEKWTKTNIQKGTDLYDNLINNTTNTIHDIFQTNK